MDCQRGGFSAIVQDSGWAERASETKTFCFRCGGIASVAGWREGFAGAGVAGKFEPGVADLDERGTRD